MAQLPLWLTAIWQIVDGRLRSIADGAKRMLRLLRVTRVLLFLAIFLVVASAVVGILWPEYFAYAYAAAAVALILPLMFLVVLVSIPLRARSVIRLIDMGYPENARELAIRLVARKLRDQSIETEELLVETAWNETKKILRRVKEEPREGQAP